MSKERARKRAKDNALKLAKKRAAVKAAGPQQTETSEKFNSGDQALKGTGGQNQGASFGPARRGSARSG